MAIEIVVPQVGEAVSEVVLVRWLKEKGDYVRKGEPLFEVDTDKAVVEIEAFAEGILASVLFPGGSRVMPQQVVGVLEPAGAIGLVKGRPRFAKVAREDPKVSPIARRLAEALKVDANEVKGTGLRGRVTVGDVRAFAEGPAGRVIRPNRSESRPRIVASPKARRLAKERGTSLDGVRGTGPDGLIIAGDVHAGVQPTLSDEVELRPLSKMRQVVAARMQESKQQVPHFYLVVDVDMTEAQRLRVHCSEKLNWKEPPSYNDLVVRACALSLAAMPDLNVRYGGNGIAVRQTIDIGIAVTLEEGLIVPVLPLADNLDLGQTSEKIRALVERARNRRMRDGDLMQKSMVVSNLGMYGVDSFIAIIDAPDPMILAVGRVIDRVVALDGHPAVRPMCTLTLSIDHRVLDGAKGAEFLVCIRGFLERAFELLVPAP